MRPQRIEPGPDQESVWDYPRPPRLEEVPARIEVVLDGVTIADTSRSSGTAYRVLETSHPPTYYLPGDAFAEGSLVASSGGSMCEWKGRAAYADLIGGGRVAAQAAWTYPTPTDAFRAIQGHYALYPGRVDACFVDGEPVMAQPGGFYGGWVTSSVVGPFKGGPESQGW